MSDDIGNYLHDHRSDMIDQLGLLVCSETPTENKENLDKQGEYLAAQFEGAGAEVVRLRQAQAGDHLRIEWGQGRDQILILGHMDTVWPVGTLDERPWRIEGSKGFGPACYDMKGGLVIGLWALKALAEAGKGTGLRLVYLLNSDEETGSLTSRPLIEAEARKSKAVLVLEPSPRGAIVTSRKGVGLFVMVVRGKAAHAGVDHVSGVSAVEELANQVLALHRMTDYARGTTVNVGTVRGGTRVNVVAAEAHAEIDLRITTAAEAERMTAAILSLTPRLEGSQVTVSGGLNRPPFSPSQADARLYEQYCAAGRLLGLKLEGIGVGGASDGNFTAALGIPTLDGLGIVGYGAHAEDEWVDVDSLPVRASLLASFLSATEA